MHYIELTNQGLVRKQNEDALAVVENKWGLCAIVCDGIGGANAGEVASQTVVDALTEAFLSADEIPSEHEMTLWFHRTIDQINESLFETQGANDSLKGMGTTASVVFISSAFQVGFNIGDSRIYALKDDALEVLSHDQTYAYEMYLRNEITFAQQEVHPKRNVLMNALGIKARVEYEVVPIADAWDFIIVCSDGLHGYVSHDAIFESFKTQDLQLIGQSLMRKALESGAPDNVSFIVIAGEKNE